MKKSFILILFLAFILQFNLVYSLPVSMRNLGSMNIVTDGTTSGSTGVSGGTEIGSTTPGDTSDSLGYTYNPEEFVTQEGAAPGSPQPPFSPEEAMRTASASSTQAANQFFTLVFQFFGAVILFIFLVVLIQQIIKSF